MCTGVNIHAHVHFVKSVKMRAHLMSLQVVQACVCAHEWCVCVCVGQIWSTGYLHNNQVCTFMHMYVLCDNSDSVRNKNPKSLQVVLCVCAMCVYVFIHAHVRFVKTMQVVQAQSHCVCVCVCVCAHVYTFMHMYAL